MLKHRKPFWKADMDVFEDVVRLQVSREKNVNQLKISSDSRRVTRVEISYGKHLGVYYVIVSPKTSKVLQILTGKKLEEAKATWESLHPEDKS